MSQESKPIYECPVSGVIDVISKKWSLLIIAVLGNHSSMRYNNILKELKGVSPKTLADTLKELAEAGIISRKAFNEIPPRVEYTLTKDGEKLRNVTLPMIRWAVDRSNHKECVILRAVGPRKSGNVKNT
jgi:DNA-binding HxlR family transcriptional regulator